MNAHYISLAILSCVLNFLRITSAREVFNCPLPYYLAVDVTSEQTTHFFAGNLTVYYKSQLNASYVGPDAIGLHVDEVIIDFDGYMNIEYKNQGSFRRNPPQLFNRMYVNRLEGVARRFSTDQSSIDGCRIFLLNAQPDRPETTSRIANQVRRIAESCLELRLCPKFTEMTNNVAVDPGTNNETYITVSNNYVPITIDPNHREKDDLRTAEKIFNVMVDVGIAKAVELLGDNSTLKLIDKSATFGWGAWKTGVKITNGTFSDLADIKRIADVVLSRSKRKLMVSLRFGINKAHIQYTYSAQGGTIFVKGLVKAILKNINVAISIAVDYNSKCQLTLDQLVVTWTTMEIELTGLGSFNLLVGSISTLLTSMLKSAISNTVESEARSLMQQEMHRIDCEKYRPPDFVIPSVNIGDGVTDVSSDNCTEPSAGSNIDSNTDITTDSTTESTTVNTTDSTTESTTVNTTDSTTDITTDSTTVNTTDSTTYSTTDSLQ